MDGPEDRRCTSCALLVDRCHSEAHWDPKNPLEVAPSFAALELSAGNSCHLCGIVLVAILDSGRTPIIEFRSQAEPILVTDINMQSDCHYRVQICIGSSGQRRMTFWVHVFRLDRPIEEIAKKGELWRDILQDSFALLDFFMSDHSDQTSNSPEPDEYSSGESSQDVGEYSDVDECSNEGREYPDQATRWSNGGAEPGWSRNNGHGDSNDSQDWFEDNESFSGNSLGEIQDICTDQGLEGVVTQVKRWLATCTATHACSIHQDRVNGLPPLPTRVLDVGSDEDPSLCLFVPQGEERAEYISLSYCWGRGAQVKMTQATLNDMQQEIRLATLPQTIQDAIVFTRRLGVRYLWVDALCMIQADGADDEIHVTDWRREAARFGDYYQNALCTLAATGSHSVSSGLFLPSNDLLYPKYVSTQKDSGESSVHIWIPDVDSTTQLIWQSPLSRRGWAVQERILSPRIVHFTRRYRIWECGELRASERCPDYENEVFDDDGSVDLVAELRHDLIFRNVEGIKNAWTEFRSHYCHSNFTKPSDRLPALSGLARRVQDLTGAKYYAGIWEGQIKENLAWYMAALKVDSLSEGWLNESGPSWSLASMARGWPKLFTTGTDMMGWQWTVDEELRVLDARVQYLGRDTDGLVSGGVLTLEGLLGTLDMRGVPYHRDPEEPTVWNHGQPSFDQIYWDHAVTDGEMLEPHPYLRVGTFERERDGVSLPKMIGVIILGPARMGQERPLGYRRKGFGIVLDSSLELGQTHCGIVDLF